MKRLASSPNLISGHLERVQVCERTCPPRMDPNSRLLRSETEPRDQVTSRVPVQPGPHVAKSAASVECDGRLPVAPAVRISQVGRGKRLAGVARVMVGFHGEGAAEGR